MDRVRILVLFAMAGSLLLTSCRRQAEPIQTESHGKETFATASWYDVPPQSLAARRAGAAEFTAASNYYKIGTRLKVTRVANNKSVLVQVTDTGLKGRKSRIDLCRGAAEKLDMVSDGVAKVSLEIVKDSNAK